MDPPGGPKGRRAATSAPERASPSAPPGRTPPPSVARAAPPGSAAACASADAAHAPCHRQVALARRAPRAGRRRPASMTEVRGRRPVGTSPRHPSSRRAIARRPARRVAPGPARRPQRPPGGDVRPPRASPSAPPGRTPPPSVALVAPPGSAAACASADAARAPCHRQGAFARRAHRAGGRRPARMAETRGLSPVAGLS